MLLLSPSPSPFLLNSNDSVISFCPLMEPLTRLPLNSKPTPISFKLIFIWIGVAWLQEICMHAFDGIRITKIFVSKPVSVNLSRKWSESCIWKAWLEENFLFDRKSWCRTQKERKKSLGFRWRRKASKHQTHPKSDLISKCRLLNSTRDREKPLLSWFLWRFLWRLVNLNDVQLIFHVKDSVMSTTHNDTKLVTFYFTWKINWTSFKFTRRHKKRHRNEHICSYWDSLFPIRIELKNLRSHLSFHLLANFAHTLWNVHSKSADLPHSFAREPSDVTMGDTSSQIFTQSSISFLCHAISRTT